MKLAFVLMNGNKPHEVFNDAASLLARYEGDTPEYVKDPATFEVTFTAGLLSGNDWTLPGGYWVHLVPVGD